MCEALDEPVPGESSEVTVTLRNATAETLYVPSRSYCSLNTYELTTDALEPGQYFGGGGCGQSCSSVLSEDCNLCEGGSGACPPDPQVVLLPPGATYEARSWTGGVSQSREIPEACVVFPQCAATCTVGAPAPAGDYVFSAAAVPTCESNGADCACPSPDESCVLDYGATVSGDAVMASVTVSYPTATAAEIVFE